MVNEFNVPKEKIADFCRRWKIAEFALFGSVLREDFSPESDIDALVTFAPDAGWSLLDNVDIDEVWNAADTSIPALIKQIETLIPPAKDII